MADNRGQRLRAARKKRFKSARAAAMTLSVPVSTYGAHERAELPGGRDYGPEEARRYARYFGVAAEWLLMGRENSSSPAPTQAEQLFPIMAYVGAKSEAHYYAVAPGLLDQAAPHTLLPSSTVAFELRDVGLAPFENWIAFFDDSQRQPPTPGMIGTVCVIGLPGGTVLVKQLLPSRTGGRYDLHSRSAPPLKNVSVDWVAPLLSIEPPHVKRAPRITT